MVCLLYTSVDNLSQWEQTVTAVKAGMAVDENAVKAIQQNVDTKPVSYTHIG